MTLAALGHGCRSQVGSQPIAQRDALRTGLLSKIELTDGRTTAGDTRRILGAPDYWNDDGSFTVYYTEALAYFAGTPGSQPELDRRYDRYFLLLKFDDTGVLRRHRLHRLRSWAVAPDVLDRVVRNWGVRGPIRAAPPQADATAAAATAP